MKHLSAEDRIALAEQLGVMKRQVLEELRGAGLSVEAASDRAPAGNHEVHSHADQADAQRLDDLRFAEIDVDRTRLQNIELAQQRMADGRYGICADCGTDIPRERLQAQPIAIRCAACETASEMRQRSGGRP